MNHIPRQCVLLIKVLIPRLIMGVPQERGCHSASDVTHLAIINAWIYVQAHIEMSYSLTLQLRQSTTN